MRRSDQRLAAVERWTEWPLTILAVLIIPLLLAPHVADLSPHTQSLLDELDYLIWGLFVAEFLIKLGIAPRRLIFLRTHWIDALLVALPMLRPLRVVRSIRGLRALRAGRSIVALARVSTGARRLLHTHGLHYVLGSVLVLILVGGSLAVVFERNNEGSSIQTLPDGIWWAITTVTTVGYGDLYPKTAAGRGVGVALMLIGIALFGAVTANLAAYFVEQQEDNTVMEIRELRKEIARLEELVQERIPID